MKIMVLLRIFAQIVDILVGLAALIISYIFILPVFLAVFHNEVISAVLVLAAAAAIICLVQYPFLKVNQTIGKGFFSLIIETTNDKRPLTVSIIFQREIFLKLMSCYLLCIPTLFGNRGGHEAATETRVVRKSRG